MQSQEIQVSHDSGNKKVTGILMALEGLLQEAAAKISDSLTLLDIGEETDLTKSIKETLTNPITNIDKSNEVLSNTIEKLKLDLVKTYALNKRERLNFLAYSIEDYTTHFFIGLKKNDDEHRDTFYDLLEKYEKYKMSETHPMVFHFVPSDMLEGIYNLVNIPLHEQASKSVQS